MHPRQLDPAGLKRISERTVSLRDIRWLAEVDVDRAALEERWGGPETVYDDLAEWVCFAFSPVKGEAFFLQRETEHPPMPQFGLSVTRGLFSAGAAAQIVEALGIVGARLTQVNAEVAR
ncbi:hypothetical protein GCM10010365_24000 [Streptomyces poonensis]|uniref:Uncharacterized protein n=1 Tax=Streptomyces poonensis TaxID=68255 RepID=A0A918UG94_9ACTN|nr:hypothetical protein GCM10010365_24000 [Streptomyces poonensis]GLJ89344.1 hypothetical protein GCM10017589_19440 [Streptomyces poonensis]